MTCHREDELIDALGRGFVGPELAAHVAGCEACAELKLVAGALLDDRVEAIHDASVPSSAAMFLRMQIRHRHDIELAGRRSLLIGHALTAAIAIGLITFLFGQEVSSGVRYAMTSIHWSTPLLVTIAMTVLAAPVAGWWATR